MPQRRRRTNEVRHKFLDDSLSAHERLSGGGPGGRTLHVCHVWHAIGPVPPTPIKTSRMLMISVVFMNVVTLCSRSCVCIVVYNSDDFVAAASNAQYHLRPRAASCPLFPGLGVNLCAACACFARWYWDSILHEASEVGIVTKQPDIRILAQIRVHPCKNATLTAKIIFPLRFNPQLSVSNHTNIDTITRFQTLGSFGVQRRNMIKC